MEESHSPAPRSRRSALSALCATILLGRRSHARPIQVQQPPEDQQLKLPEPNEDPRLPDGRSQKNAIAKQQHEQALKEADQLVAIAEDLRNELRKAGTYVVPVGSVKKTEDIEKLAKRIRGRLKF